jgi:hypothetical protein
LFWGFTQVIKTLEQISTITQQQQLRRDHIILVGFLINVIQNLSCTKLPGIIGLKTAKAVPSTYWAGQLQA